MVVTIVFLKDRH